VWVVWGVGGGGGGGGATGNTPPPPHNVLYNELPHILNMELQTDEDTKMHLRLLQYHINLHAKYELPVLSVVLYPFELHIPEPPYQELSGDRVLLSWEYGVIALYKREAEQFLHKQAFCMYIVCSPR
jgi:hypothetical protein